ncbi:hypothetical protein BJ741DRAFT_617207 [Chytriomyces cf. hyalinus JEL632]|nr:hypothetical protein BJ741DRAFT_617207 [Chytriomyces cf. hyalinus JEL632]
MQEEEEGIQIARWSAVLFTVLASPFLSILPYVCGCFSRDSRYFQAYYLQGIGIGSLIQSVVLFFAVACASATCAFSCELMKLHDGNVKDMKAKGSECESKCSRAQPAGYAMASFILVVGVISLWRSRLQILKTKHGRF